MRVFAVDDDPVVLELLQQFFKTTGKHKLTTASSVVDALEALARARRPYDCFLLDVQMPDTDGIEFCRILRGMEEYRQTPVLMLTSMADKEHIDGAFDAGATDYVTKPFEVNSLKGRISLIENLVEQRKERTGKIFALSALRDLSDEEEPLDIELHNPFPILDVDGVIENNAMENYLRQLSRKSLCGSVVIGFTIRNVDQLHKNLTGYDFGCVITDVAEALSDCLLPAQRLISYAGNGTFVSVIEGLAKLDLERLVAVINLHIRDMELCSGSGEELNVRICAGQPSRLVWRNGDSALDALRHAHVSAEEAAERYDREFGSLWTIAESA